MVLPDHHHVPPYDQDSDPNWDPTLEELEAELAENERELAQLDAEMDAKIDGFMVPWVATLRNATQRFATKAGRIDWDDWDVAIPDKYEPAFQAVRALEGCAMDVEAFLRHEGPLAAQFSGRGQSGEFIGALTLAAHFCFLEFSEVDGRCSISVSAQGQRALAAYTRVNGDERESDDDSGLNWFGWLVIAALALAAGWVIYLIVN